MPQSNRFPIAALVLTVCVPVFTAAITGLIIWISKIDERQYNQKDTYATKVELKDAMNTISQTINDKFDAKEKADKESKDLFLAWLERIETAVNKD